MHNTVGLATAWRMLSQACSFLLGSSCLWPILAYLASTVETRGHVEFLTELFRES
jgi:hypothetical protein